MLAITGLSKTFTLHTLHGRVIKGFHEISFALGRGRALGLSGQSGTGKSSVLKCIYRAYLPSTGEIVFQSKALGPIDLVRASDLQITMLRGTEIGYVTQFLAVVPRVSALDTVAEPLLSLGVSPKEARRQAGLLLERLFIPSNLYDACPVTFSGGEQQRVNFAAGIIARPRLLLLDEPTASLDEKTRRAVIDILLELKALDTTMIAIFHDRHIMEAVADEIYPL
jgi:alpha-D-ribose 1-methylphosphonate 5-triphosphate synthase subunit PhnL